MSAIKKLSWSAVASLGGALLDILRIAILVRFLEPEDFGIFAIVLVVVSFCQLFSEGGVGNALVSKEYVSPEQAGNILNFNLLISAAIYLLMAAFSPMIAHFYAAPQLSDILLIVGIAIPLSAYARILQAMLQRALELKIIAKATLLSRICGLIVAVVTAKEGLGIYALVYSTLTSSLVLLVMLFFSSSTQIKYSLTVKWEHIQPILNFSVYQLGEFLLNFFAKNFDVLLITKLLGAEASGVYVVIKNLLVRVGDIIVSTFVRYFHPLLAKIQNDQEQLRHHYLCFFRSVVLSISLAYLFFAVNNEIFVTTILGSKYLDSAELVYLMCIWLTLRYCTAPVATFWLVRQKPQVGLYWNIAVAIVVPMTVYFSYSYGLGGVITGLTLIQVFFLLMSLVVSYRLAWCSTILTVKQIVYLFLVFILCLPGNLLINQLVYPWEVLLIGSSLFSLVIVIIAWKKRALFIGDKVDYAS